MAYQFETVKLDKGMYSEAGRSFTKVLEKCDPSEQYKGTPLEHLDAFQRQLKRFDIKVKGADSDVVSKFFASWESAVLFPEYVARAVRQGMEENNILPLMTAAETRISGMDYRSIASTPTEEEKSLKMVAEGAIIPETRVSAQENLVKLHKRGRMLVASYEAIQFQRLDLFSVTLRQIGAYINRMHVADAIDVICNGDGNKNGADRYTVGTKPIAGTAGTLSYDALVDFWSQFAPYTMNTLLVGDAMAQILKLEEMQDSTAGLAFQGTGKLVTPIGATLLRSSAVPPHRLLPVLLHALAALIQEPQAALARRVAVLRRRGQVLNELGLGGQAVDGDLDGHHCRVGGGLLQKPQKRVHALKGVGEQQVVLADLMGHGLPAPYAGRHLGMEGGIEQRPPLVFRQPVRQGNRISVPLIDRPVDGIHLRG